MALPVDREETPRWQGGSSSPARTDAGGGPGRSGRGLGAALGREAVPRRTRSGTPRRWIPGLFALATRRLTRLAEERPEQAEVAYLLGQCEAARGNVDAALKVWARIPPDSPWAAPAAEAFAQGAIPLGHSPRPNESSGRRCGGRGPERAFVGLLLTVAGPAGTSDRGAPPDRIALA